MAGRDTLTVIDNRTGKQYELPIEYGAIRTADLGQIKASPEDAGLMGYDPALTNTATCKSRITFKGPVQDSPMKLRASVPGRNILEASFSGVWRRHPTSFWKPSGQAFWHLWGSITSRSTNQTSG